MNPGILITLEQANTIRAALADYDFLLSIATPRLQLLPEELAVMAYLNEKVALANGDTYRKLRPRVRPCQGGRGKPRPPWGNLRKPW